MDVVYTIRDTRSSARLPSRVVARIAWYISESVGARESALERRAGNLHNTNQRRVLDSCRDQHVRPAQRTFAPIFIDILAIVCSKPRSRMMHRSLNHNAARQMHSRALLESFIHSTPGPCQLQPSLIRSDGRTLDTTSSGPFTGTVRTPSLYE